MHKTEINGSAFTYILERKNVKNINLRVNPDGSVHVSAHPSVPIHVIDCWVISKEPFVLKALQKYRTLEQYIPKVKQYEDGERFYFLGEEWQIRTKHASNDYAEAQGKCLCLYLKDQTDFNKRKNVFEKWVIQQCLTVFECVLKNSYECYFEGDHIAYPVLKIRDMKTRWGSCHIQKQIVTLNKKLIAFPLECIEYVALHELIHLIHPDHSKRFYALLETQMPDWKARKQKLNDKTYQL